MAPVLLKAGLIVLQHGSEFILANQSTLLGSTLTDAETYRLPTVGTVSPYCVIAAIEL
jgi:hypothetical protein